MRNLAPLDRTTHIPGWLSLTLALLALGALTAYEVRAILRAAHPGVRASVALAMTAPLFLLLFSATHFLMAQDSASNFNVHALTRTDALYFTITVFASVGFGDIAAISQSAQVVVMVQMILDLIVIGLVVRLFLGAVQHARQKDPSGRGAGDRSSTLKTASRYWGKADQVRGRPSTDPGCLSPRRQLGLTVSDL